MLSMLGLCFVMEAVVSWIKEQQTIGTPSESDFGIQFSTSIFGDWLCTQLINFRIPSAKDALASAKADAYFSTDLKRRA